MKTRLRHTTIDKIKPLRLEDAATVHQDTDMEAVLDRLLMDPATRSVYVLDDEQRVVGAIRIKAVTQYVFPYDTHWPTEEAEDFWTLLFKETAGEFMVEDFRFVHDDDTVADLVEIVQRDGIQDVPVVDRRMRLLGEVTIMDVMAYYRAMEQGTPLIAAVEDGADPDAFGDDEEEARWL